MPAQPHQRGGWSGLPDAMVGPRSSAPQSLNDVEHFLQTLQAWLKFKEYSLSSTMDIDQGLCAGLSMVWLYYFARDKESYFFDLYRCIEKWDGRSHQYDQQFEEFLNMVFWFQAPQSVVKDIYQTDLIDAMNMVLPEKIKMANYQYQYALIFMKDELREFLKKTMTKLQGKMCLLATGDHTLSLFVKSPQEMYLYDPNQVSVSFKATSVEQLIEIIIKCLQKIYPPQEKFMPLAFNVFDFAENKVNPMPLQENGIINLTNFSQAKKLVNRTHAVTGKTALCLAVQFQQLEMVDILLKAGANPSPALWIAAASNKNKLTQKLLEAKADANTKNPAGNPPLIFAAYFGNLEEINLLVQHHADVNAEGVNKATPLLVAAESKQVEAMRLLLKLGAKVKSDDVQGNQALHISAKKGDVAAIKLLLEHQASETQVNIAGCTPLYFAGESGNAEAIKLLLSSPPLVVRTLLFASTQQREDIVNNILGQCDAILKKYISAEVSKFMIQEINNIKLQNNSIDKKRESLSKLIDRVGGLLQIHEKSLLYAQLSKTKNKIINNMFASEVDAILRSWKNDILSKVGSSALDAIKAPDPFEK